MANQKFIISGGGTGGHIFPAISIANALKKKRPDAKFLFVGAEGRMEMEKVPNAGYEIVGLPVSGFNRSSLLKNFKVLFRLFKSLRMAKKVVRDFAPDIAVGLRCGHGLSLLLPERRGLHPRDLPHAESVGYPVLGVLCIIQIGRAHV